MAPRGLARRQRGRRRQSRLALQLLRRRATQPAPSLPTTPSGRREHRGRGHRGRLGRGRRAAAGRRDGVGATRPAIRVRHAVLAQNDAPTASARAARLAKPKALERLRAPPRLKLEGARARGEVAVEEVAARQLGLAVEARALADAPVQLAAIGGKADPRGIWLEHERRESIDGHVLHLARVAHRTAVDLARAEAVAAPLIALASAVARVPQAVGPAVAAAQIEILARAPVVSGLAGAHSRLLVTNAAIVASAHACATAPSKDVG